MFEEVFVMLRSLKISPFDCLIYMKEHTELYSKGIKEIIENFIFQTTEDLYDSWEKANQYVLSPDIINKYIGGEMGINELLLNRAHLFSEFDDVCYLIFESLATNSEDPQGDQTPRTASILIGTLLIFITL